MMNRFSFSLWFVPLVVVFGVILLAPIAAQAEDGLAPDFRDLYWGDPLSSLGRSARELTNSNGMVSYYKPGDDLSLGSLRSKHIAYIFFDDRLMGIIIGIRDEDTGRAKGILKAKYGEPVSESRFSDDASWITDRTIAFLYDRYDASQIALLSVVMNAEYEAWQKEQDAKDAAAW